MFTPQDIKDQEFEIKFRGYEPSEVKKFLEVLSDNFLELTEQNSAQVKEIFELKEQLKLLTAEKEVEEAAQQIAAEELAQDSENVQALPEEETPESEHLIEIEKLRTKVAVLEEMNNTLRQEELDFKTTITAAQSFSDSLKEASVAEAAKLKEESEARAAELKAASEAAATEKMESLRLEIESVKQQSEQELAQLVTDIEQLKAQKEQVKGDLKSTLYTYLDALEVGADEQVSESSEEALSTESAEVELA